MLRKKMDPLTIAKILFPLLILILFPLHQVYCDSEDRLMSPIFDGKDGLYPELKLTSCYGYDQTFKSRQYSNLGFQSTKVTCILERWLAKPAKNAPDSHIARGIRINRFYFQYPGDSEIYLYLPDERIEGSATVPPWPKTSDIGEKTIWYSSNTVIFTKGKILVQLHVNSTKLDKEYTKKIAHMIESHL